MTMNPRIQAYISWLQCRGQIWPLSAAHTSESDAFIHDQADIPEASAPNVPTKKLAKHVVFASCEALSSSGENMRVNMINALKLTDYEWLHAEPGNESQLIAQLNTYQANYIVAFGKLTGELLAGRSLSEAELPCQELRNDSCLLIVPSISSMIAQPKSKIAVWQLFQSHLLKKIPVS